jgi:hypothetical protein
VCDHSPQGYTILIRHSKSAVYSQHSTLEITATIPLLKSPIRYLPYPITPTAQCHPPPAPSKQWCSKPTAQKASATPPPPRKTASRHGTRMLCAEAKQTKPLPRCCASTAGNYERSGKRRRAGGRICDEVSLLGCGCRNGKLTFCSPCVGV